jgi:hypothetical protein
MASPSPPLKALAPLFLLPSSPPHRDTARPSNLIARAPRRVWPPMKIMLGTESLGPPFSPPYLSLYFPQPLTSFFRPICVAKDGNEQFSEPPLTVAPPSAFSRRRRPPRGSSTLHTTSPSCLASLIAPPRPPRPHEPPRRR